MKKLLLFFFLSSFSITAMRQPASLQEQAVLKISLIDSKMLPKEIQNFRQRMLNAKLLTLIKQSAWKVLKDNAAQYNQNVNIIKSLLSAGADPNFIDPQEDLPLIYYAANCIKQSELPEWQPVPDPDIITGEMVSSFLWAMRKEINCMRLLLEHNANPNKASRKSERTWTILHSITAYTNNEPIELAQLLLQYGADPLYPRNESIFTALDNALELGNQPLIALYEKGGVQKLL